MRWTNLDTIVKGLLIARGYPIHYYMQFLYLGSRGYEELHFDSLACIKTIKIPINSYRAVPVPCNLMDIVKVGIPNGQFVRPLTSRPGISSLNNFDDAGNKILYGEDGIEISAFDSIFFNGYQTFVNENGEFTGRMFGIGSGNDPNTFKFIPEREEIQLHENIIGTHVILQFITDGTDCDNATMIIPYAKSSIETYIIWQMKEGSRIYTDSERGESKRKHDLEHAKLRARKNTLTKDKIKAIVRKHTHGSIKG